MNKKIIDKMYDAFPDEEVFAEDEKFDSFLVGDGSVQLMKKVKSTSKNSSSQLTGIHSVGDLFDKPEEDSFQIVNDISDFDNKEEPLEEGAEDYFYAKKKEFLDKFGFLTEKSKSLKGKPIRERDLVLSNDDSYLLHYMENLEYCTKSVLSLLAQLSACKEMGFTEVKFHQIHGCPLCTAYQGTVHKVGDLISRIGSGQPFIHRGTWCDFIPVIRNRDQFNDIQNGLTLSVYIDKVYFRRLPLEFVDLITSEVVSEIPYDEVSFVSFPELISKGEVKSDDVVLAKGSTLLIRDDYIFNYSPFDFLMFWLKSLKEQSSDELEGNFDEHEVLYLNGKKVIERNGTYLDIETGKVVSLLGGDES